MKTFPKHLLVSTLVCECAEKEETDRNLEAEFEGVH